MSNVFRHVKKPKLPRNPFNLGHEIVTSTEFGRITPFLVQEVVPGDSFRISAQMLIRMAALYAPTFSRVNAYVRYYYVSQRLINDYFETFITGGENGDGTKVTRSGLTITAKRPFIVVSEIHQFFIDYFTGMLEYTPTEAALEFGKLFSRKSLFDYLGFPSFDISEDVGYTEFYQRCTEPIDLTPFIAYHMIVNEYYRDENFQKEVDLLKDCNGNAWDFLMSELRQPDKCVEIIYNLLKLRTSNYQKDYFTSALPFPQRGEDTTIGENDTRVYGEGQYRAPVSNGNANIDIQTLSNGLSVSGTIVASVNEFRRALAVQKFKEALARFGARYTEFLQGIFGTSPTDSRLQRPEFIGGGRIPIQFGQVLQTSETNTTPMGSYAGQGLAGGTIPVCKSRHDEPGWIIGLLTIVPKAFYAQGWPRKFSRFDRFDFFIPQFQNIGEQEILQKELVYNFEYGSDSPNGDPNQNLFGYIPRYSEMRTGFSEVHGDFRSTLLDWHTARLLTPSTAIDRSMLNSNFLQIDNESANRIFNYRSGEFDHFWINIYNDVRSIRPLSKYGTPMI